MSPLAGDSALNSKAIAMAQGCFAPRMETALTFLSGSLGDTPGPFLVTYVLEDNLKTPKFRRGRYVSSRSLSLPQTVYFLNEFRTFLAGDGRHGLIVNCLTSKGAVVYDQHDFFYVYGVLDSLIDELRSENCEERSYELPVHGHWIQDDSPELSRLMGFWHWTWKDLEATDTDSRREGLLRRIRMELRAWWFDRVNRTPD